MPDETKGQQGEITSAGTAGTSTESKTFTAAELAAHDTKLTSDALSGAGRTATELKAREDAIKADRAKLTSDAATFRQRQEADEETTAKRSEDPSAFDNLLRARSHQQAVDDLAARTRAQEEKEQSWETERLAAGRGDAVAIAAELRVSQEMLEQFSDGSDASMRKLAVGLPKTEGGPAPKLPDSGISQGGGQSAQQIRDAYIADPQDPAANKAYMDWRRAQGL